MTTITVDAIVTNGMLKPMTELNLPEGTRVRAELQPQSEIESHAASLFGAFPELAVLADDDFKSAKSSWESAVEKQAGILGEKHRP